MYIHLWGSTYWWRIQNVYSRNLGNSEYFLLLKRNLKVDGKVRESYSILKNVQFLCKGRKFLQVSVFFTSIFTVALVSLKLLLLFNHFLSNSISSNSRWKTLFESQYDFAIFLIFFWFYVTFFSQLNFLFFLNKLWCQMTN